MKEGIRFGATVIFSHILTRQRNMNVREWTEMPFEGQGIFLGYRTLSNGSFSRGGADYGGEPADYGYYAWGHFKVGLVAYSPKTNPVYVPIESLRQV